MSLAGRDVARRALPESGCDWRRDRPRFPFEVLGDHSEAQGIRNWSIGERLEVGFVM